MSQMPPQQTPPPEQDRSTLILVLGIVTLVACQVLGPIPWIMGKNDLEKIRQGRIAAQAEPLTKAGMICGIIATALFVLGLIFIIFQVLLAGALLAL